MLDGDTYLRTDPMLGRELRFQASKLRRAVAAIRDHYAGTEFLLSDITDVVLWVEDLAAELAAQEEDKGNGRKRK